MDTATATHSPLDALTPSGYGYLGDPTCILAGLEWQGSRHQPGYISHHRENEDWMALRRVNGGYWIWEWNRKLAEGVYVTVNGGPAADTEATAQAAVDYLPVTLDLPYMGRVVTWYEITAGAKWKACIDGEAAELRDAGNQVYLWTREHAPATDLLALCGGYALSGRADSLPDAMIAAIDAPDRLRLMVARMAAGYSMGRAA